MQSWTSTGYFSNSTGSFVTNCRFSSIIGAHNVWTKLGGPMYGVKKSTNTHFLIIISRSREVRLSIWFVHMFHHKFAMQHEFCCVNPISRHRMMWKKSKEHPHTSFTPCIHLYTDTTIGVHQTSKASVTCI